MARDDFKRYYLRRVAIGEACGCSEAVIRFRDIEASRREVGRSSESREGFAALIRRFWVGARAGLKSASE